MKQTILSIVFLLLPIVIKAEFNTRVHVLIDKIYYCFDDENDIAAVSSGNSYYYRGNLTIPQRVYYYDKRKYYTVTAILDAFEDMSELTSITIPNSVTSIGDKAFYGCSNLASITIPDSVTSIGDEAFKGCTSFTSITIPKSVSSIGAKAFYGCTNLTSISITNSLTFIGSGCFDGTAWYESQPDGLVYIGNYAYRYKGEMQDSEIKIRYGTLGICGYAFSGYSDLSSVTIPNSVIFIGESAFKDCKLTSLSIPNNLTYIGKSAFENGIKYKEYYDDRGYYNYDPLSISIPNTVTYIGERAFYNCSIYPITFPDTFIEIGRESFDWTPWYDYQPEGVVYAGKHVYKYNGMMPDNAQLTIREGTLGICREAFFRCDGLNSIKLPNSLISIDKSAFEGCTGLSELTLPNSLTTIGETAFRDCRGLTTLTLPSSITTIGGAAFSGCSGLVSVNVLCSPTILIYNELYGRFPECTNLKEATFDCETVTKILSGTSLERVTITDKATSIDRYAFGGQSSLTSVTIPNSVTSIGASAFVSCSGLTSITIPNSVTSIGDHAFEACDGLTSISIPNSVTSIGDYAFIACDGLSSITIPDSVTSIAKYTFAYCSGLTSVTIPNSVTYIGSGAFRGCPNLTNVYCQAVRVPNTDSNSPFDNNLENTTLHVPSESIDSYNSISPWSSFGNIVALTPDEIGTGDTNGDGVTNEADIVDIMDVIMSGATGDGISFADVNGDGVVNVADIVKIANIIMKQ